MNRSIFRFLPVAILALALCLFGCSRKTEAQSDAKSPQTPAKKGAVNLPLESFDGGFFTIEKPRGWNVVTAGSCADFAFLVRDPQDEAKQIFYFGEVGPVYMDERQKLLDQQYMAMGGYPIQHLEMPAVTPLTPQRFLEQFHLIASTRIAQTFMPGCPRLDDLQVISAAPQPCPIANGSTALVRAIFRSGSTVGEGLFHATVAPMIGYTGGPGGNIAYGFLITGITAPKGEFAALEPSLLKSVQSFNISQRYVDGCLAQQEQTYAGIRKAGKTLSETSDLIMQGWENRNRSDDIIAEKRSDAILGRERVYNPSTGEVYEFENGFFDKYDLNRGQYEMNNLQLLPPDNYNLWTAPTLDGPRHLR